MGDYMRYQVSNCDLRGDQAYFFDQDIFPLAFVEVRVEKTGLNTTCLILYLAQIMLFLL